MNQLSASKIKYENISSTNMHSNPHFIGKLNKADIILVHTKRSLWGWLIRKGTHCYWNHAMLITSSVTSRNGYVDAYVVDPKSGGTVEKTCLVKYLNPDKYDISVRYLNNINFPKYIPPRKYRDRICKIAVEETGLPSKMPARAFKQLWRQIYIIFRFIRNKLFGPCMPPRLGWNIHPSEVKAFTCAGFIQWCYYQAAVQIMEERGIDTNLSRKLVFRADLENINPYGLLTTTPADLASSNLLSWRPVMKRQLTVNKLLRIKAGQGRRLPKQQIIIHKGNQPIYIDTSKLHLAFMKRLSKKLEYFSGNCDECKVIQSRLEELSESLERVSTDESMFMDNCHSMIRVVVRHLKRQHKMVHEKQYIKRMLAGSTIFSLLFIAIGYILVLFGNTLLSLSITLPSLFFRTAFSGSIGYFLDMRAKKQGRVL